MEVLESKVKGKLKKTLSGTVNGVALTGNELFEVQQAVQKVLETSDSLKGFYVRKMLSNLERLDPVLVPIIDEHSKLIKELVKKNKDGQPERDQNGFKFENDDNAQKYQAKVAEIFEKELYTIEFVKMSIAEFDNMPVNTKEHRTIYLVLKYLVE